MMRETEVQIGNPGSNPSTTSIINTPTAHYLFLIAILVASALLRFHQIGQPFIDATSWREADVASVADNYYRGHWNIFYPEVSWDGPGPSYQGMEFQTIAYISAVLYLFLGQHDWVGRSLAVLFSLWGIFSFYHLVSRIWNTEHALASAAVFAILPGSIYIDRSFVPDSAMLALVITGFWFLTVYLQTERIDFLVLAGLFSAWGFLTKLPGLIVGIPMIYAICAILGTHRLRRSGKVLFTLSTAAVLTIVPVIAYYLWARHLSVTYPPFHFTGSGKWLWNNGLRQWLHEQYFLSRLYQHLSNWLWTKPVIALVIIGLLLAPPRGDCIRKSNQQPSKRPGTAPWLFHWWLLAMVIYYFIGAQQLVTNPTNLNVLNPVAAALAGNSLMAIASFIRRVVGPSASLALMITILLVVCRVGYGHVKAWGYHPYAEDAYKLGLALRQSSRPDDLVVTMAQDIGDPVAIYYSRRRGWVFPPATTWSKFAWWDGIEDDREAIRLLEELRGQGAGWFGIVSEQKAKIRKYNPKLFEYLERTFEHYQETSEWVIYRIPPQPNH
jgi:hypothetical protein